MIQINPVLLKMAVDASEQDVKPKSNRTARETALAVTSLDPLIAEHTNNRKNHPLNYWLNPLKGGPLAEVATRLVRRSAAGSHRLGLAGNLIYPTMLAAPFGTDRAKATARMHAMDDPGFRRELDMMPDDPQMLDDEEEELLRKHREMKNNKGA